MSESFHEISVRKHKGLLQDERKGSRCNSPYFLREAEMSAPPAVIMGETTALGRFRPYFLSADYGRLWAKWIVGVVFAHKT